MAKIIKNSAVEGALNTSTGNIYVATILDDIIANVTAADLQNSCFIIGDVVLLTDIAQTTALHIISTGFVLSEFGSSSPTSNSILRGTADVGHVGTDNGARTAGGIFTAVTSTATANTSTVTVTFPAVANTNYAIVSTGFGSTTPDQVTYNIIGRTLTTMVIQYVASSGTVLGYNAEILMIFL